MGHTLGAGWLDDEELVVIDNAQECYSGESCVLGGSDATPEEVDGFGSDWSIMAEGGTNIEVFNSRTNQPRFAFSIEETATTDFQNIPSIND